MDTRLCELCGCNFMVQNHHIIKGKGKRKQCETPQSQIDLCWYCHYGTYGVHGREGSELDNKLKVELQETYFNMGYSEEKVKRLMGGKFYFKEGQ